jgi:hypothetical protein
MDDPEYYATPAEVPHRDRVCIICGLTKPIEEFYPRPTPENPYCRHRQCIDCQKATARRRHAANPESKRQRMRECWSNLDAAAREKRRAYKRAWYAGRAHAAAAAIGHSSTRARGRL